jgi:predicted molibdopterin-dependent oxidoreductase YjgC
VNSKDRLQSPLIREGNGFREASWEEALTLVASKFTEIKNQYGPDAMSVIISSKCTNEDGYLMQKFARAVLGTNNIDNCSRYCQAPATTGLFRTVGYGGDSGSIENIAKSGLVLIVGSNTAEGHPVLATRVKRAHKLFGQRLIVADPREHEMARRADIHFRPRPGTDLVWLSAMSRYMIDNGYAKMDFVNRWVNGFEEYRKSLDIFTMEYAARICEVPLETLYAVAKELAEARSIAVLWAMGITQHMRASDGSTAISNLLLVTGNYMKDEGGAFPLRGHNNVQGAGDIGAAPHLFPGYQSVSDPEIRAKDMSPADSNANHVAEAFGKLDCEPDEALEEEFDLFLNNGRQLEHFHEGNMTARVLGIHEQAPERYLEISEELAQERNIESGQWVRVTSRHGSLKIKALVTKRVFGKQVYLGLYSPTEGPINILTGSHADNATNTPAYKETAVKLDVLPEKGSNPLKPINPRFSGKPTPQNGVEVERKWARKDYRMPGTPKLVQIQ